MKQLTLEEYCVQVEIETAHLVAQRLELVQAQNWLATHEERMASFAEAQIIWGEIGAIIKRLKAQMIPSELVKLEIIEAKKGLVAPSSNDAMIATEVGAQRTIH